MVSPSNNIIEYRAQIFKPSSTFIINEIQLDATVRRYLFTAKSLYMFWVSPRPSSGVLKTVTAASGTGHNTAYCILLHLVGNLLTFFRKIPFSTKTWVRYVHKRITAFMQTTVIFVKFGRKLNSFISFCKNTEISNFMKIRPIGAKLFHADGRTDRHDEVDSVFLLQLCENV